MVATPSIKLGFDKIQKVFLVEAALTRAGYTAGQFLCEAMLVLSAMGAASSRYGWSWSRSDFQELAGNAYDWAQAIRAGLDTRDV